MSDESDRAPSKPGDFICLDATPLMTFAKIAEVEILRTWFPDAVTPAYVMENEILKWKEKYSENKTFDGASWPQIMETNGIEDAAVITQLGQFFAEGAKNVGELHVMALTHRFRGTAIIDDNSARKQGESLEPKLKSVFMVSMVAAAATSGLLTPDEAWELHCRVERTREPGYAIIRATDDKEFKALLHFYRQIEKNRGWKEWPYCLHNRLLDTAAIAARKDQLTWLYERLGFGAKK